MVIELGFKGLLSNPKYVFRSVIVDVSDGCGLINSRLLLAITTQWAFRFIYAIALSWLFYLVMVM